jgi:hypothetical protein
METKWKGERVLSTCKEMALIKKINPLIIPLMSVVSGKVDRARDLARVEMGSLMAVVG